MTEVNTTAQTANGGTLLAESIAAILLLWTHCIHSEPEALIMKNQDAVCKSLPYDGSKRRSGTHARTLSAFLTTILPLLDIFPSPPLILSIQAVSQ